MDSDDRPSDQKENNDLKPLKAIIHGPPAAGKTSLAKKLCLRYGAHYVSVKTMIEETLQELRDNIEKEQERIRQRAIQANKDEEKKGEDDGDESPVEDEQEEDEGGEIEDWQEQIKDITVLMEKSPNHKLPDQYVARLMKIFLGKEPCRTRGYVLDGYPKTSEQAREIFGQVAETEQAGEGGEGGGGGVLPPMAGEGAMEGEGQMDADMGMMGQAGNQILPDYVVSLVANDDFLCERVMKLPQREIQGTHYEEESMLRRLLEFREYNTEQNTMLIFFDEIGIHPIVISLIDEETEKERDLDCIYDYVSDLFGEPIPGFGLSAEEMEQLRKLEREQRRLREEEERLEKQLLEEKARKEYQDKMEKWVETLEKLQMEEEKILVAQSEPLRYYLMKYVFPVLSKGLIEVAKIRPDDPLDYLAEYLFRENPEGRMFDPSYTREGELIIKQYEEQVAPTIEKNGGSIAEKMRSSV